MKLSLFMPNEQFMESLSLQDAAKIPYIIAGDIVCFLGILGLSVGLIFQQQYVNAILSLITVVLFFISLIQIKHEKVRFGSYLTTAGLLTACIIILFFGQFFNTTFLVYRNAFFIVVMALCNQLISLNNKQPTVFAIGSIVLWALDWITIFRPFYTSHDIIGVAVINNFAVFASNAVILLITSFNTKMLERAEKNEKEAQEALSKVTAVFSESKNGLTVGKRLNESAQTATTHVDQIKQLAAYLIQESANLNKETSTVKDSGSMIEAQSQKMKESVDEQASSITETSAAITQISGNIASITKIASAQHSGMDEIVSSLDAQRQLLSNLVKQITQVKESSDHITAFVNTIDNISSQTSLLAMNASIEAAHAGNYGKGFSVIAQEIRKLSDETTKSAAKISETLQQNSEIVETTTNSVNSFATYTDKNATVLTTTLQAIEEILSGISEMNIGIQEIMKAIQNIVNDSQNNTDLVTNVAREISQQKIALENISNFSGTLRERTAGLASSLEAIESAINQIQTEATENISVGEKISAAVNI